MDCDGSPGDGRTSRPRLPQQARSRATRAKILDAAVRLVNTQGIERMSMTQIARQAGIGVGTLYHYFPDKRTLLLELVDAWAERVAGARRLDLQVELFMGSDPRAALAGFLRRVYRRLRDQNFYAELLPLTLRDDELRSRFQHLKHVGAERLAAVIELGQRGGRLRMRPDPMTAAVLITNALESLATQVVMLRRPEIETERMLDETTDMLCRYLVDG